MMKLLLVLILPLSLSATGCATTKSPTGRTQLILFSDKQIGAAALEAYTEVKKTEPVVTSGARYDAVQRVGTRIAATVPAQGFDWEFILIDTPVVNAWCMPGGKVAVYTGILPVAKTEAGLAAILGHEIAHAIARHSNERASQGAVQGIAGAILDATLGDNKNKDLWMAVFGAGTTVGILLPYSRAHETEADQLGLSYMARAGYDPSAAPELWDRMAAEEKSRTPQWLSTHPDPAKRAQKLRELLPAAQAEYEAAPVRHASRLLP